MKNTMRSIIDYFIDNYQDLGLSSASGLKVIEKPKSTLTDGGKWLTVLALQTLPDENTGTPFEVPEESDRSMTQVEIECKMRSPDPSVDFLWNELWGYRDSVISTLAGPEKTGILITRYDWTDPNNPVADGQIWFSVKPQERLIEDQRDPANKSVFLTYNVHWWKSSVETFSNDPWLEALAAWTEGIMGPEWIVYRGVWPLVYGKPSILWRLIGGGISEKARAVYEVQKNFSVHVLGRTPNEKVTGVVTLAQELGNAVKIVLNAVDRRYMVVRNPILNLQADALKVGQITVALSRLTSRPVEEVPYIMSVEGSGNLS